MRYVIVIGALLLIVGGIAAVKVTQIKTLIHYGEQAKKAGPPPESVGTTMVTEDAWEDTLLATGTVAAVRGVSVSNDAAGVVTAVRFESGQQVKAGQVLVELDSSVERAQLLSAQARQDLASVNAGRSEKLIERQAIARSQLDNDLAQVKTSNADTGQFEAQIARKTIRAPFSGFLGIRNVNLGQYLNPGTAVTTLEQLDSVYVDFNLPQQHLPDVQLGQTVRVHLSGGQTKDLEGVIRAIDPGVDVITRTVKLRANIANDQGTLRSGMFVEVTLPLGAPKKVVTAPATAVIHASYGDSVFVVESASAPAGGTAAAAEGDALVAPGKVARQHFVKLGQSRGDYVAFLDGVQPGQELVSAGAFKLRNNSPVVVDNTVKVTPSLNPAVVNH